MVGNTGVSVMSGYRDRSSFDPYAYEQPGRPMRPFNWVQWTGVALEVLGIALYLTYFAGKIGWIAPVMNTSSIAMPALLFGVVLINSRREPGTPAGSEQLKRNQRMLLIIAVLVSAVIGIAAVIDFFGVK